MESEKISISNHYWSEVFTAENIIEYGKAAKELSCFLRILFKEGFDSIVIPSRGAMPIFRTAVHAWFSEASILRTQEDRFESKVEILGSPIHAVTILPFSADPTDEKQTSKGVRHFWVKVLSALIRRDGRDPHLVFYQKIVQRLQRKELSSILPRDLPSDKFIFIDTVVSGRAIDEILEAFEAEGIDKFHLILLVDNNGESIKGIYKRRVEALMAAGRCTTFNLKSLWTEDRGPSVSGVWSTVYPQVLSQLQGRYSWSGDIYGAGSFYHKVSSSQESIQKGIGNPDYNMPITMLHAEISVMLHLVVTTLQNLDSMSETHAVPQNIKEEILEKMAARIEYHLEILKGDLNEFAALSPLEQDTTMKLAAPRLMQLLAGAKVSVSSSHLVRVELPQLEIEALFSDFDRAMQDAAYNALGDDWFRRGNEWAEDTRRFLQRRATPHAAADYDDQPIEC